MNIFRNARQNLLRRQAEAGQADLERQEPRDHEAVRPSQQEMQQQQDRPQTATRSFRRGADTQRLSSATAGPRPTSSHYTTSSNYPDDEILSPKTPQFAHGIPPVLSEQLNLHELQNELQNDLRRLSSRGSSGPQSPAGSNTARPSAEVSEPVPAMTARHMLGRSRSSSSNSSSGSRRDRRRRRFAGADPAEMHLASMAEDGRRRQQMANGPPPAYPGSTTTEPKHSFFCLPYIRSRRTRAQIVRSIVSGVILASTIAVVLALYLTNNVYNMEFLVLLLLMVLVASLFFFHGLVRLCLMILHPMTPVEEAAAEEQSRRRHAGDPLMPNIYAVGGYAIPDQPIRVVLARDEEAAGIESDAAKLQPPAYGLWRESVRVDPDRIYWQRNENAVAESNRSRSRSTGSNNSRRHRTSGSGASTRSNSTRSITGGNGSDRDSTLGRDSPRPPSYMSEDGVRYVVEAQPRSIAPAAESPLPPHPSEVSRAAPRPTA
ncbi:MAG: hypothetical protein STHCBS139747_000192 [Sporothrix thermara]